MGDVIQFPVRYKPPTLDPEKEERLRRIQDALRRINNLMKELERVRQTDNGRNDRR